MMPSSINECTVTADWRFLVERQTDRRAEVKGGGGVGENMRIENPNNKMIKKRVFLLSYIFSGD